MKNVQTSLNEVEYEALEQYAKRRGKTIKQVVREATLKLVLPDEVYPDDPYFREPPSAKRTGIRERTSVEHDKLLYGGKPDLR